MAIQSSYDSLVIGAGMSGLSAAIRLAMSGKKVCIVEKHFSPGGLNSYYQRGKRKIDVGLHAMTNFSKKGVRNLPLGKILKQLRISYDALNFSEQKKSMISFEGENLNFSNNFEELKEEILRKFPGQEKGFLQLLETIVNFDEVRLENDRHMARSVIKKYITDTLLEEMLLCPLLIYGSSWENDMAFSQFVIMFKAIYFEGLMRPEHGVRPLLKLLENKLLELGGEIYYKKGVSQLVINNHEVEKIIFEDGSETSAKLIFSSIGVLETQDLLNRPSLSSSSLQEGKLSFCECLFYSSQKPSDLGINHTLIFHNEGQNYHYRRPDELIDNRSAVLCFPNNFQRDDFNEGLARVTFLANYDLWKNLNENEYKDYKKHVLSCALQKLNKYSSEKFQIAFQDCFTPLTVQRYTSKRKGLIYGHESKIKNGATSYKNLFICGTDQGFLGIVGSLLSGISIANLWGVQSS